VIQFGALAAWLCQAGFRTLWGVVQRQHSGLWIRLSWFESERPSLFRIFPGKIAAGKPAAGGFAAFILAKE
jgi:hypothetical protein